MQNHHIVIESRNKSGTRKSCFVLGAISSTLVNCMNYIHPFVQIKNELMINFQMMIVGKLIAREHRPPPWEEENGFYGIMVNFDQL